MATATVNVLLLMAGLLVGAAQAQTIPPSAYQLAAQRAGIPSSVLYAVALQESGIQWNSGRNQRLIPWPWSLNIAGQSRRFDTRIQACTALQQALRDTPSTRIDVGLAQINLGYQRHRYRQPCELLDPTRNLANSTAPMKTGCWR